MKGQDKLLRVKIEAQEAGNLYRQHLVFFEGKVDNDVVENC